MAIDFKSSWFKSLSLKEKKEIIKNEFLQCKNDFKYFIDNYAYIRHPNAGIIKVKFFDFQYDVCIPVSIALKNGRTEKTKETLKKFKFHYEYEKHINKLFEEYLDLYEKVPSEFHNFYKIVINHPEYITNVDSIILKSRQTGLSTAFQLLEVWHANFYTSVYDLTLSQGDKEAIKFMSDMQRIYELLPVELRGKRLKNNDHELWISLGNKDVASILQAFTSTPKAGRSYSPNLVVLDEFAFWRRPEDTYTAISMALSGGGIMVIISTPNGVGNLYHKLWELSKNYYSSYIENNLFTSNKKQENDNYNVMRPVVVHWTQLPFEEFERRGFKSPLDWYNFMRNKLLIEGGERKVAQELDLDFILSGKTLLPFEIIKKCKEHSIEKQKDITIIKSNSIDGLIIYEKPKKDYTYLCGVDVCEGVFKDYHCIYIIKVFNEKNEKVLPQIVAKYKSNSISPNKFSEILISIAKFYNNAFINVEKNNPGLVVLSELIENNKYNELLVLNRYNPVTNKFLKNEKGWRTSRATKPYLESVIKSFILTYGENINLPNSLLDEMITFYESNFHDDEVIAFGLALIGYNLIEKYKEFLYTNKKTGNVSLMSNIEIDTPIYSSHTMVDDEIKINEQMKNIIEKIKKNPNIEFDLSELLKSEIENNENNNNDNNENEKNNNKKQIFNKFLSKVETIDYDGLPVF